MNRFTLKSTPSSTPSSEGTGLFCRVPWPEFSRAPWIIHPTHLSWFPVRFACPILRSFSRQHRLNNFRPFGHGLASQDREKRICQLLIPTRLHRDNQRPACLSSCVNLGFTANGFFTRFIVTHVSIITSPQSSMPYDTPSAREERSPTRPHSGIQSFGTMLSPVTFSAQRH